MVGMEVLGSLKAGGSVVGCMEVRTVSRQDGSWRGII